MVTFNKKVTNISVVGLSLLGFECSEIGSLLIKESDFISVVILGYETDRSGENGFTLDGLKELSVDWCVVSLCSLESIESSLVFICFEVFLADEELDEVLSGTFVGETGVVIFNSNPEGVDAWIFCSVFKW